MKEFDATIDRFEAEKAVLTLGDERITLPRHMLPDNSDEGDVVTLIVKTDTETSADRRRHAKEVLNEILKPDTN